MVRRDHEETVASLAVVLQVSMARAATTAAVGVVGTEAAAAATAAVGAIEMWTRDHVQTSI